MKVLALHAITGPGMLEVPEDLPREWRLPVRREMDFLLLDAGLATTEAARVETYRLEFFVAVLAHMYFGEPPFQRATIERFGHLDPNQRLYRVPVYVAVGRRLTGRDWLDLCAWVGAAATRPQTLVPARADIHVRTNNYEPDPDLVETLVDLAKQGDEGQFRELAAMRGVPVADLDAMWEGTVARMGKERRTTR